MKAISEEEATWTDHLRPQMRSVDERSIEELRVAAEVNYQRRQLKLMVCKALAAAGLLFLICGGSALIAYVLN